MTAMEKLESLNLTAVEDALDEVLRRLGEVPLASEYIASGVREAKHQLYLAMREALSQAGVVA